MGRHSTFKRLFIALVLLFAGFCVAFVPASNNTTLVPVRSAFADTNLWAGQVNHNGTGGSPFSGGAPYANMFDGCINYANNSGCYGKPSLGTPHVIYITHNDNSGQFNISSVTVTSGQFDGASACSGFYDSLTIETAATKADKDSNNWVSRESLNPANCGTDTFDYSGGHIIAYSWRFTFNGYHSALGEQGAIQEIEGFGSLGATLTPTHTPTITNTPTITHTPTRTFTPTRTATPTQTAINVQGSCGNPGQVPCHVYWLTPGPVYWLTPQTVNITGTVVITGHVQIDNFPTPYEAEQYPTVQALLTAGPGSSSSSGSGGNNYDIEASGYHFVTTEARGTWCMPTIPFADVELCIELSEITAVNFGPVAFPIGILGIFFLIGIVVKQFLQA